MKKAIGDVRDYYNEKLEVTDFQQLAGFLKIPEKLSHTQIQSKAVDYTINRIGDSIGSCFIVDDVILPNTSVESLSELTMDVAKTISPDVETYYFAKDDNNNYFNEIPYTEILLIPIEDLNQTDVASLRKELIGSRFLARSKPMCKILIVSNIEMVHYTITRPLNKILQRYY